MTTSTAKIGIDQFENSWNVPMSKRFKKSLYGLRFSPRGVSSQRDNHTTVIKEPGKIDELLFLHTSKCLPCIACEDARFA